MMAFCTSGRSKACGLNTVFRVTNMGHVVFIVIIITGVVLVAIFTIIIIIPSR